MCVVLGGSPLRKSAKKIDVTLDVILLAVGSHRFDHDVINALLDILSVEFPVPSTCGISP